MLYSKISQSKLISNIDMLIRNILFEGINTSQAGIRLLQLYLSLLEDYDYRLEYSSTITAFKNSVNELYVLGST